MFGSILRKEFLKLRAYWLAAMAINLSVTAYVFATMLKLFRMDHAEVVWYRVIHLGQAFYEPLMYLPILTGLFLAFAQFAPEMKSHRFRISLHLPLAPHLIVLGHILVGLSAVALVLAAQLCGLAAMVSMHFPFEAVLRAMLTYLPWALAGLVSYLGATLVILEPTWKLRVFNFLVAAGVVGLYMQPEKPGAYTLILPQLLCLLLVFTPSVLLPAYRFRFRKD